MADDILERGSIIVTRFIGPASLLVDGEGSCICYQVNKTDSHVQLTRAEAVAVAEAILRDVDSKP